MTRDLVVTMSKALSKPEDDLIEVRQEGPGRYVLSGALSLQNARSALSILSDVVQAASGELLLDLRAVTRADSAGLALLIEVMRLARARGLPLRFRSLPAQVEALAIVSGVDAMLRQDVPSRSTAP